MERKYENATKALAVAKEAVWLAWNAAGTPRGMGLFQNRPGADKDAVWDNAYNQSDYAMRRGGLEDINADYVFGRMMKLYFTLEGDRITHDDTKPSISYQSWCGTYPSYSALFDAAETEVDNPKGA